LSLLADTVGKAIQQAQDASTASFKVETKKYPIDGVLKAQDENYFYTEVLLDKGNGEVAYCKWHRSRFYQ